MLDQIARKRTGFEKYAWEQVRELMPRRQATRGIQYEALEYLFEHLYEKISEEQLKDHFLKVKGHLQQKGDPVKSAINLAIKELQRLHEPTFELIKIQEASVVGKMRRYVQLNYTAFDSVIDYDDFRSYIEDLLTGEELPVVRSVYNSHPGIEPALFPGLNQALIKKINTLALISSFDQVTPENKKTRYFFIPESHCNQSFLLLYENESSVLPFLGFVSDIASVAKTEQSRFIVYRGEEKMARLEFFHRLWMSQHKIALSLPEVEDLRTAAKKLSLKTEELDESAILTTLITRKTRKNWETVSALDDILPY